jgi:hypothetical protein
MKKMVSNIYNAMPGLELFLEDNICVFSHDFNGGVIHYPDFSERWTSSEHSNHSTEFTEGGTSIDAEFD